MTTIGRPLRRMVSSRAAGGLDRLRLEQPPNHDTASVLSRICISPSKLIRHAFAVATQPDVVDPAKPIEVFRADWGGHGRPPMLSAGNMLSVRGVPAPRRIVCG